MSSKSLSASSSSVWDVSLSLGLQSNLISSSIFSLLGTIHSSALNSSSWILYGLVLELLHENCSLTSLYSVEHSTKILVPEGFNPTRSLLQALNQSSGSFFCRHICIIILTVSFSSLWCLCYYKLNCCIIILKTAAPLFWKIHWNFIDVTFSHIVCSSQQSCEMESDHTSDHKYYEFFVETIIFRTLHILTKSRMKNRIAQ